MGSGGRVADPVFMKQTPSPTESRRRLALLPVEAREERPAIRRYRLGRVLGDLGPVLAQQTPAPGVRSP